MDMPDWGAAERAQSWPWPRSAISSLLYGGRRDRRRGHPLTTAQATSHRWAWTRGFGRCPCRQPRNPARRRPYKAARRDRFARRPGAAPPHGGSPAAAPSAATSMHVRPQSLDIVDLEAGPFHAELDVADAVQFTIRENVTVDELGGHRLAPTLLVVRDAARPDAAHAGRSPDKSAGWPGPHARTCRRLTPCRRRLRRRGRGSRAAPPSPGLATLRRGCAAVHIRVVGGSR